MSLLIRTLRPNQVLNVYKVLSVAHGRRSSHFFPDYKPGPTPKTEEERIAAAKKYNLLPEEYEPYDESEGFGDYPKLPLESIDAKDPWYPWDKPELRKDYGEPVHVRTVNLFPEYLSTTPPPIPYWKGSLYFLLLTGSCALCIYGLSHIIYLQPVSEKQYVTTGVTHYTFDIDHGKKH